MSKCDIRITFDNQDRQYRGGETVSGKVHVKVNKDIRSNGIVLNHYWKTHGRGNTEHGPKQEIRLAEEAGLLAGEELQFPFQVEAPLWPLSYHGHYINVDHYVHVAVDVPWAIDPKHEEDYLLTAGAPPQEFQGDRSQLPELAKSTPQLKGMGKTILLVVVGVFAAFLGVMLIFLVPFILIGLLCFWGWKKAIKSRVGNVTLTTPHVLVAPGDQWPLKLQFTPQKSFRINGISLQITGTEAATSGSGTNSTTYRHTLHDETIELHPGGLLLGMEEFDETLTVKFPETNAWNLDKSSNKISWQAKVRIDIPRFPDWSKTVNLQLAPAKFFSDSERVVAFPTQPQAKSSQPVSHSFESTDRFEEPAVSTPSSNENSYSEASDLTPVLNLIDEISNANRFGNERTEIVSAAEGKTYDVRIKIDRITSTFGYTGTDDRYEKGRTVIGTIFDSDQTVQIFCAESSNDSVDDLSRGDTFSARGTVSGWDSLYNRLVVHEA